MKQLTLIRVTRIRHTPARRVLRVIVGGLWVGAHITGALDAAAHAAAESETSRFVGWAIVSVVLGLATFWSFEV